MPGVPLSYYMELVKPHILHASSLFIIKLNLENNYACQKLRFLFAYHHHI